ncbi:MAG: Eco47II family restriction endonuclease [Marinospirillum sp.]|uniref:Eco47II family restriction endonuclease n=1 Tax=Marinospirillum sp. TaxID=2183934 RepID=UPI001A0BF20A|nr:Eco47II family restriction endonuclease [Marinospirillum sp.]MBE0506973.1 Eco47II family restriction endonuclease [Marinospirillum sp.]
MSAFDKTKLKEAIRGSIRRVYQAQIVGQDIYRNTLDCFSAVIDSLSQNISLDQWMKQEHERQIQKTKQNAIGTLHEEIIGSVDGVTLLPIGNVVDIVHHGKKIIAEIKNKHNTTKGNHKVSIYRDLEHKLNGYPGYTGYYVEILPKNATVYNKPFIPSDNQSHMTLPYREDIRVIDGRSFYSLITGNQSAIDDLYNLLPLIVSEIIYEDFNVKLDPSIVTSSVHFCNNFNKAYVSGS